MALLLGFIGFALKAHNLKVVGSNPTPATNFKHVTDNVSTCFFVSNPL